MGKKKFQVLIVCHKTKQMTYGGECNMQNDVYQSECQLRGQSPNVDISTTADQVSMLHLLLCVISKMYNKAF